MQTITNNRRSFMRHAGLLTAATLLPVGEALAKAKPKTAKLKMPQTDAAQIPLPFDVAALDPVISARTIEIHYGKHHKIYADKVQAAIKDGPLAGKSLEDIITTAVKDTAKPALFNMSAQVWNHNFYWQSLSPKPAAPSGKLLSAIEKDFGSLDACKKALGDACVAQFGSGWGWLVLDGGKLKVVSTSNADIPFLHGQLPLLNIDVWEHAYYLDYQNKRADHVAAVIEKTLNWDFAAKNFEAA
jgi:Fe-Mn family superoxide dismutase